MTAVALSLVAFGSVTALVKTCAVAESVPAAIGVTTSVTVVLAPLASVPTPHASVPMLGVGMHVGLPENELIVNGKPGAMARSMWTKAAGAGPPFVVVTVYVSGVPIATGSGESVSAIERSALAGGGGGGDTGGRRVNRPVWQ